MGKRKSFRELCRINNLNLNYPGNRDEYNILKAIFINREYSDYFPFYKKVTIIDVGAHLGYFSIFAKNNIDKDSRLLAIEPDKSNFEKLKQNISDCGLSNISTFNFALGDRNGRTRLYKGQSTNHSIVDNYSLLETDHECDNIEVKTLDEFINMNELDRVDFLKMDCEGAEYQIFQSTPRYIFDKITTISMEFHDLKNSNFTAEDIVKKLIEFDFKIVKYKYERTSMNLNYGKIIGTKSFNVNTINNR